MHRTSWKKWALEDKLANLVIPVVLGVAAAMEAGKLLENLPDLWEEADLTERRKLLMAMLDAVYVDTVDEKSVVAIRPKPAFRPIFEVATTRAASGIAIIGEGDDSLYSDSKYSFRVSKSRKTCMVGCCSRKEAKSAEYLATIGSSLPRISSSVASGLKKCIAS